jgi:DNA-binding winged helix-turn-helix (wHTH) protein/energy-coupling factor transporter ATP-binding protein EcfA2
MCANLILSFEAMSGAAAYGKLKFGPFELSIGERSLRREGVWLRLGGRALDLLIYLAERPGEVIAKQELIDHVWPDVTVEEGSLRVHVAAIRKALGDGQSGNRYIANIKGRGYSFVCTVAPLAGSTESGNDRSRHQGRLPVRPLMVIDRESVISEVNDKLRDGRFVTLLGPGGIGKTTIALAVGRAAAEEFGGEVYFVDLESLSDLRHVAGAVATSGGNITGFVALNVELEEKRLELLREVIPHLSRVAVLGNSVNPLNRINSDAVRRVAERLSVTVDVFEIKSSAEVERALRAIVETRPDAALLASDTLLLSERKQIADAMAMNGIPAIYPFREYAEAGGFIAYGSNISLLFERSADYVGKILDGENPGDLPIQQATKFEVIINLKAAANLGLTLPAAVLARADEVIE